MPFIFSFVFLAIFSAFTLIPANAASAYSGDKPYIVLIPGAGASGGKIYVKHLARLLRVTGHGEYFAEYEKILDEMNLPYLLCPKTEDRDERRLTVRAAECVQQILGLIIGKRVRRNIIIIGHSMGGNIARMVAVNPLIERSIHSVLTIASPHQGTVLADFVFENMPEGVDNAVYAAIMNFIGFVPDKKRYLQELVTDRRQGRPDLYVAQDIFKNPKVKFYSLSNSTAHTLTAPLELTRSILSTEIAKRGLDGSEYGIKNDGIVPEYSMIFGKYLGHIEADHWETLCIGILSSTKGCHQTKSILIPTLQQLVADMNLSN